MQHLNLLITCDLIRVCQNKSTGVHTQLWMHFSKGTVVVKEVKKKKKFLEG